MFFEQTFTIYHDNGNVEFIENLMSYISNKGGIDIFHARMKYNLVEFHKRKANNYYRTGYYSCDYWHIDNHVGYYVCTESGLMVSPDIVYGEYMKIYRAYWYERYNKRANHFAHNRSWRYSHNGRKYKRPQTHNARRAACSVLKDEGEPEFRGSRKMMSIPTNWDDIKSRYSTGWKYSTKRKHQYKGN